MPFVPVPNVAHVQFIGSTDAQETVNDLYFVSTAPPIGQATLAALVSALSTWYGTVLSSNFSESWTYSHARGRDLTSEFSFVSTSTDGAPAAGGVSGEQAPNNVAANITFSTSLAGRNNHGSNRVPAIANSNVTLNTLDSTFLGNVALAYSQLIAPSTTLPGGWTWVVVSRFSGSTIVDGKKVPTPRVEGIFHEVFDVFFADDIVDSQKTRLPKHGR